MKIAIVALCLVAAAAALPFQQQHRLIRDVSEILAPPVNVYLPPSSAAAAPQSIYLPPVEPAQEAQSAEPFAEEEEAAPSAVAKETSSDASEANAVEETEVVEAATEAVPETAVFGENGYEYRAVRKLRLRKRRDVSHLNLGYLPPLPSTRISSHYLPPQLDVPQPEVPQLKISNEYLPPVNENLLHEAPTTEAVETEAPETEAPNTTEAPTTTEAPITTEVPITTTTTTEAAAPEETAVLADDGYHYRKPAVLPDLGFSPLVKVAEPDSAPEAPAPQEPEVVEEVVVESAYPEAEPKPEVEQEQEQQPEPEPDQIIDVQPERAYLPPLEPGVVEAEGPGEESAALHDDGYHYRVVKRVRLF